MAALQRGVLKKDKRLQNTCTLLGGPLQAGQSSTTHLPITLPCSPHSTLQHRPMQGPASLAVQVEVPKAGVLQL